MATSTLLTMMTGARRARLNAPLSTLRGRHRSTGNGRWTLRDPSLTVRDADLFYLDLVARDDTTAAAPTDSVCRLDGVRLGG